VLASTVVLNSFKGTLEEAAMWTEFGERLIQKMKDMGIAIYNDRATQNYLAGKSLKACTWFSGVGEDAGPHTTTVLLGVNANDATIYEEYLHVLNGEARGWLGITVPDAWVEEVEVETLVLSKADELGMTQVERRELQQLINTYRKDLYYGYGIIVA
jgi:hypothetical protein